MLYIQFESIAKIIHKVTMVKIIKRDGSVATFDVSKIQLRIEALAQGMSDINIPEIVGLTAASVYDGISTEEIDAVSAEIAIAKSLNSQSYAKLAAALTMSNLHKSTPPTFTQSMEKIQQTGVFQDKVMTFIRKHAAALDAMINHEADYKYNYLSICVMKHGYLFSMPQKYYHEATAAAFTHDTQYNIEPLVRGYLRDGITPTALLPPGMFQKYTAEESEWVRGCTNIDQLAAALWRLLPTRVRYVDRPQYALARMAICLHIDSKFPLESIRAVYTTLSAQKYIHGTSTFVNACGKNQQLLNCFLLSMEDSTIGILNAQRDSAIISRGSGGVGICLDAIRAKGQLIKTTGGKAAGTVRVAKLLSETALTWNQGGRRPGSFAEYISTHHADIIDFLIQGNPTTAEENRTTTLFRGVMMTEHLYLRWQRQENYSLFSEDTAPGLMYVYDGMRVCDICGWCPNPNYAKYIAPVNAAVECSEHKFSRVNAFTQLYDRYEREYRYITRLPAAKIIDYICQSKLASNGPYILNKDAINRRSRQDPSGTITMSNLCAEIVELSTPDSTACCTLASCVLQNFLNNNVFDFNDLIATTKIAIESLDRIIDCNNYPTEATQRNNLYFRPVGLGVQGLADLFRLLRVPYISDVAEQLDMLIHEAMYYAALSASCELAKKRGPCPAWTDRAIDVTPEYELWAEDMNRLGNEFAGVEPRGWKLINGKTLLGWNFPITKDTWSALVADIKKYGVRNTYVRANMPTVNTGDILGSSGPSTEPVNFNVFNKTTVGSNKMFKFDDNMIKHLTELGHWTPQLADIVAKDPMGRLPHINVAGWDKIREIYLTAYEIPQTELIRRAGMRQAFIDQTQSFNQFMRSREMQKLRGIIAYGFKYGLKTVSYYTRMLSADKISVIEAKPVEICSRDNPNCASCQS